MSLFSGKWSRKVKNFQSEGFFIEFEAFDGTGERDPEFLVELVEGEEVGAGGQGHLVKATGAKEIPRMGRARAGHRKKQTRVYGCFTLAINPD